MTEETAHGRYYCESCRRRFGASGDCPRCPGEPLLDLADDDVRLMLEEATDRARMRRYSIVLGIVLVASMPVSIFLAFFIGFLIGIPAAAAMVAGLTALFIKIFQPKEVGPRLSPDEVAWLKAQAS